MKEMLDSNLLRCFLAILESRKLTVAADDLCITQPALSKSLRRLEEELGVSLFDRTPTGMVPTAYGIALGRRARLIELESRSAREEIRLLSEGGFGSLTIGIGPLWSAYVLPDVVASMIGRRSDIHVRVVSGVLDKLLPDLLQGKLDVVCTALDFPDHPDLQKIFLFDSQHVIVGHESHPLASRRQVQADDLCQQRFVGLDGDYAGFARMEKYFALHGLQTPNTVMTCSSLETLFSALKTGKFLASISSELMERAGMIGLCRIDAKESFWRFRSGLVYRLAPEPSHLVRVLEKELLERFAQYRE
ncbi:MAG: LysR family transcriptional regulator [Rhodocyclaceae bacterium]|nr:LysR family transcriptional regulator [Rhodocyclaceae bacterium]